MRHYIVEKWIDTGGEKVSDSRYISETDVDPHKKVIAAERFVHYFSVDGHYSLRMERSPTEKETCDNGN